MNVDEKYDKITKEFADIFSENYDKLSENSTELINKKRQEAFSKFKNSGIPRYRSEDYKYTNLEPRFSKGLDYIFEPSRLTISMDELFRCDIPNLAADVVMVLNGFYFHDNMPLQELPGGAIVGSFAEASKKYPEIFEKYYNKIAANDENGLTSLNTSFTKDGLFLYVPENAVVEKPIQVINIGLSEEGRFIQFRNLIVAEKNSQANLVVCDHSLSPADFLTNSVTEIYAEENSILDIVNVQNEHNGCTQLTNTYARQGKNSNLKKNTITLHGGMVRNNLKITIEGEGAHAEALGLYITDEQQHVDNQTIIEHKVSNCTSNQLYKGILDNVSSGAFNGKIYVHKDAQQTVAYQKNNNIQLTNQAKMKTKPQLEIYADDVKCSHGATVGQLDDDAIFYMQARGISKREARLLMMFAFANEVTKSINIAALAERINELVSQRLRGELTRCHSCPINCC